MAEPTDGMQAQQPVAPGLVSLVGAGPGAPDLLTLRALDRIERAQVVVHDRLVGDEVLARIPASAERIDVGKSAGRHSVAQAEIHALLIEQARRGRRVVRLKGGDPAFFSRGGEEIEALRAAGIPYEIVPGITAASAAAAAACTVLTHRALAPGVALLSAHRAQPSAVSVPAAPFAESGNTLVFYMAVQRLAALAQELLDAGWSDTTPTMLVLDATRPTQNIIVRPLAQWRALESALTGRVGLLIVGDVLRLSPLYPEGSGDAA